MVELTKVESTFTKLISNKNGQMLMKHKIKEAS
jgi:hypothetical protein